jgi:hypothetical protein
MFNEHLESNNRAEFFKSVRRLDRINKMLSYCDSKTKEEALDLLLSKLDYDEGRLNKLINPATSTEALQKLVKEYSNFSDDLKEVIEFIEESTN